MRIALIGYGKMGKVIENIALAKHHQIVLKLDIGNPQDFTKANLQKADVAIEFTRPDAAVENIKKCLEDDRIPKEKDSCDYCSYRNKSGLAFKNHIDKHSDKGLFA